MNDYTDTPIGTNETVPFRVASVYGVDDKICIVDWTTNIVADFPWMAFLRDASTMPIEDSTHMMGVSTDEVEYHMPIIVPDALGFYMVEESAKLVTRNEALFHEWNKLPEALSWLYVDKPYMTSVDMAPVMNDLRYAIDTGEASRDLAIYMDTHTYRAPRSVAAYGSYGLYFENDMVVPHGKASVVNLKLGVESLPTKTSVEFVKVGDTLTLTNGDTRVLEVIIQRRIGDYVLGQTIYIVADEVMKEVNISIDNLLGVAESVTFNDAQKFQVHLTTLYDETSKFPVWAESAIIECTRYAGMPVLTSNSGSINAPTVQLRTSSSLIPSGLPFGPVSTSFFLLDEQILRVGPVDNAMLYAEYTINTL